MNKNETYYDILRVDPGATIAEIVAAYHSARAAFSKDSVATYSLFSEDDTEQVLGKLEEAYLTLSNIEKKREYDRRLLNSEDLSLPETPTAKDEVLPMPNYQEETSPLAPVEEALEAPVHENTDPRMHLPHTINGPLLKDIRQKRALSIDDVSRITKIPSKFLKAIEDEIDQHMPARVYVQGFIKNLATLYKMDPQATAKSFLANLDEKKQTN